MSPLQRVLLALIASVVLIAAALIAVTTPLGPTDSHAIVKGGDTPTGAARAATPRVDVVVSGGRQTLGRSVPRGFVGPSFEFPAIRTYTGADPRTVNSVLTRLISNLAPGQSPVLRIGGDSTDSTWWPIPSARRSPGLTYPLSRSRLATIRALALALHARVIMGANLKADRPAVTISEIRALIVGIGRARLQAIEIGNEPDNYGVLPWYRSGDRAVYARNGGYSFKKFASEFSRLRRRLPFIPLAGPAVGSYQWLSHLKSFLTAEPGLALVTFHRYPLNRCFTEPRTRAYPTLENLLAPASSAGLAAGIRPYAALAHAHGVRFRVDELNSVACGGKRGISDVFASALWVLDTLFAMIKAGVDGVNLHSFPGAAYQLFAFRRTAGRWSALVRPVYYGLLMFARAAPPAAQLLKLSSTPEKGLKAWATLTRDGTAHVLLINNNQARGFVVAVRLAGLRGPAKLERLTARRADAKTGISLAGQSFATPSYTGELAGRERTVPIRATAGSYDVTVGPTSAALLTFTAGASCCR
jgi:hypothetical protein